MCSISKSSHHFCYFFSSILVIPNISAEVGNANMSTGFNLNSARLIHSYHSSLKELGKASKDPAIKDKKLIIAGHTTDNQKAKYESSVAD